MPNRILKESICTSDDIDGLTWFEEVLFYRLIVNCDDFGRFDGRLPIIKNRLFPLKENITLKNLSAAINKLARAGLVCAYEYMGKPFLYLPTWNEHQTVRANKSKYPDPNARESNCKQLNSNENNCKQLNANESNCKQMNANVPVIQSNTYSYSESNARDARAHAKARGQYENVFLTDEEYADLCAKHADAQEAIEFLSRYIERKGGIADKNHYLTLESWVFEALLERRNKKSASPAGGKGGGSFDTDDFFDAALKRSYEGKEADT